MIGVNLLMSFVVLPRLDFGFADDDHWQSLSVPPRAECGSVLVALACAMVVLLLLNRRRLASVRESMDAGANASVLPVLSVASLVGFGAVVAAMPAFADVRDWILGIDGGLLVSLSVSVEALAGTHRVGAPRHDASRSTRWARHTLPRRAAGCRPRLAASDRRDRRRHAGQPARTTAPS